MKNRLIIAALAIGALAGCTKESSSVASSGDSAVKFTSSTIATRTVDNSWESGDLIGITTSGMFWEYNNMQHSATTSGSSTAFDPVDSGNTIYYPYDQTDDITFHAYYPYSDEGVYTTVDITDQKGDLGAVDFMTAQSTWTLSDGSEKEIAFEFEHKLSQLIFNFTTLDEVGIDPEEDNSYSATINGVVKSKAYYIKTGAEYDDGIEDELGSVELNASEGLVTAILHPSDIDTTVELLINGEKYTFMLIETLESGKSYSYDVTVGRDAVTVGNSYVTDWILEASSDITNSDDIEDGSRNNPYKIYSEADLLKIGTGEWYSESNYILMDDITLSTLYSEPILDEFISKDDEIITMDYFEGTFDGNGHTITNPTTSTGTYNFSNTFAIFKSIGSRGKVFDLNVYIEEVDYSANANRTPTITAIAQSNSGEIDNCSCEGSLTMYSGDNASYGIFLVGDNYGTVTNCENNATVTSTETDYVATYLKIICNEHN